MNGFCKSEDCPSSDELVEFQHSGPCAEPDVEIRRHLATCEFCAAELEFYSSFPLDEAASDTAELARIPAPLFELAEALLKNRHLDSTSLNPLLKERRATVRKPAR